MASGFGRVPASTYHFWQLPLQGAVKLIRRWETSGYAVLLLCQVDEHFYLLVPPPPLLDLSQILDLENKLDVF